MNKEDFKALISMYIAAVACEKVGRIERAQEFWTYIWKVSDIIEAYGYASDLFEDVTQPN